MTQENINEASKMPTELINLAYCLYSLSKRCPSISDKNAQEELQTAFSELKEATNKFYSILYQNVLSMDFNQRFEHNMTLLQKDQMINVYNNCWVW